MADVRVYLAPISARPALDIVNSNDCAGVSATPPTLGMAVLDIHGSKASVGRALAALKKADIAVRETLEPIETQSSERDAEKKSKG